MSVVEGWAAGWWSSEEEGRIGGWTKEGRDEGGSGQWRENQPNREELVVWGWPEISMDCVGLLGLDGV